MLTEHIHGVCVSVRYSDYLDICLKHNRSLFSDLVVVTTSDDKESQKIAGKYACQLVVTDEHIKDGGGFAKGAMIEKGMLQLPGDGWICHFDSDILFPPNTRQRLSAALHDKHGIYGVDRFNVVDWDGYQKLLNSDWMFSGYEHHHFLNYVPNGKEIGGRLLFHDDGYIPLGYVQITHSSNFMSGIYRTKGYPKTSNDMAHDDVKFALLFDRKHRHLIPEIFVAHLVTNNQQYGINWKGRKSPKFGPPLATPLKSIENIEKSAS